MNLKTSLSSHKLAVDTAIKNLLAEKMNAFATIDPTLTEMLSALSSQILRSGKRIRPFLASLGYRLSGGTDDLLPLELGVSFELLHQYFMVHDDIVDRDEKRYDADALHVTYAKKFQNDYHKNDPHLGLSLGMIGGDLLHTLAIESLWKINTSHEVKQQLMSLVFNTIYQTTAGWQIHFYLNHEQIANVTEAQFLKGMALVSSLYTFQTPLLAGMHLALSDTYSQALTDYAFHTGMAFQMHDDYLGMFGDTNVMGKPVGNDYREGKKTLLVLHSYKNATIEQKMFLQKTLGTNVDQQTLSQVKTIMQETEALNYSKTQAENHISRAKEALLTLPPSIPEISLLSELADFVIKRDH